MRPSNDLKGRKVAKKAKMAVSSKKADVKAKSASKGSTSVAKTSKSVKAEGAAKGNSKIAKVLKTKPAKAEMAAIVAIPLKTKAAKGPAKGEAKSPVASVPLKAKVSASVAKKNAKPARVVEVEVQVIETIQVVTEAATLSVTEKGAKKSKVAKAPSEKRSKKSDKDWLSAIEKMPDVMSKWNALRERFEDVDAPTYSMSANFEARTPIMHKVLGWGFILSVLNNRLEVLFKDGVKMLIANYKN